MNHPTCSGFDTKCDFCDKFFKGRRGVGIHKRLAHSVLKKNFIWREQTERHDVVVDQFPIVSINDTVPPPNTEPQFVNNVNNNEIVNSNDSVKLQTQICGALHFHT